ncbi:hypothetical protein FRC17_006656, partial [Serendipita sp. 399]
TLKHDAGLPPELWIIILSFAVDEIQHPYWHCTPAKFPQYHVRFDISVIEGIPEIRDWKNIRSVCKTWKQLVGPLPHFLATHNRSKSPKGSHVVTKTSSSAGQGRRGKQNFLRNVARDLSFSSNLTSVVIKSDYAWGNIDGLLENPTSFPNLRSLSFLSTRTKLPFWKCIEEGYPQLVSLTIRYQVEDDTGSYCLKNLEILDIQYWSGFRLSCPSLKHCSLRGGVTDVMMEFLMAHGHQMESILFDHCLNFEAANNLHDIWGMFPNVRMLGKQADGKPISKLPSGHPIIHIELFMQYRKISTEMVLKEVDPLATVRTIHLRAGALDGTLDDLRRLFRERGIDIVEVPNPKRPSPSRLPSLFKGLLLTVTCPFWFPLVCCVIVGDYRRRQ